MQGDASQIDPTDAGDRRFRIWRARAWKHCDHLERLLELLDEHLGIVTVFEPPRSLLCDVPLRGAREANVPLF